MIEISMNKKKMISETLHNYQNWDYLLKKILRLAFPWNASSEVFRGYKKATLGSNGLI